MKVYSRKISPKTLEEYYAKFGNCPKCKVCQDKPTQIDHDKPWSKYKSKSWVSQLRNLQPLCAVCNNIKDNIELQDSDYLVSGSTTDCRRQFAENCENRKNVDFFDMIENLKNSGIRKATIRKRLEKMRIGQKRIAKVMQTI